MYHYISLSFGSIIQISLFYKSPLTLGEWFEAEKLHKMLCKKYFPLLLKLLFSREQTVLCLMQECNIKIQPGELLDCSSLH